MLLKITAKNHKPFKGDDGEERDYYWYSALRTEDGVSIKFGSTNGDFEIGQDVDLLLEKSEKIITNPTTGKKKTIFGYKHIQTK